MENIMQFIPLLALLVCDALYILEARFAKHARVYGVAAIALHVLVSIYFLFAEASLEMLLLFLMASFAAALTVHKPKIKINETQE